MNATGSSECPIDLHGVQVRAVRWQEQQVRSGIADQLPGGQAFVASEVVGGDPISARQGRGEALANPGGEGIAVDRPVQHEGRDDLVVAQSGQKG